jgi:hypothetical protein
MNIIEMMNKIPVRDDNLAVARDLYSAYRGNGSGGLTAGLINLLIANPINKSMAKKGYTTPASLPSLGGLARMALDAQKQPEKQLMTLDTSNIKPVQGWQPESMPPGLLRMIKDE